MTEAVSALRLSLAAGVALLAVAALVWWAMGLGGRSRRWRPLVAGVLLVLLPAGGAIAFYYTLVFLQRQQERQMSDWVQRKWEEYSAAAATQPSDSPTPDP